MQLEPSTGAGSSTDSGVRRRPVPVPCFDVAHAKVSEKVSKSRIRQSSQIGLEHFALSDLVFTGA